MCQVEFLRSTQYQVNPFNTGDLLRLQLGITTRDHHQAFRCFSLYFPHDLAAFFISIFRYRTGVDDIYICHRFKIGFYKTLRFQRTAQAGRF
ncbi:hypothetical protein D3C87_1574230 [compost metagenome]